MKKVSRKEREQYMLQQARPRELWPLMDITPSIAAYPCFEETGKILRVMLCTPTDKRFIPVLFLYRAGTRYIALDMQDRSMIYGVAWNPNDGYRINEFYRKNAHKYEASLREIASDPGINDFFE